MTSFRHNQPKRRKNIICIGGVFFQIGPVSDNDIYVGIHMHTYVCIG